MTLIQDVPATSSDERMHILDETCWCNPDAEQLRDRTGKLIRTTLRHRKPESGAGA